MSVNLKQVYNAIHDLGREIVMLESPDDGIGREPYMKGINAYTIMCDDRAKFPFEKYVIAR
jgi:hypothetical protein